MENVVFPVMQTNGNVLLLTQHISSPLNAVHRWARLVLLLLQIPMNCVQTRQLPALAP